jgi:hypothetical protein
VRHTWAHVQHIARENASEKLLRSRRLLRGSAAGLRCLTRAHRPPSAREGRDLNAWFRYLSSRASDQACCLAAARIRRLVRILVSCLCDWSMRE